MDRHGAKAGLLEDILRTEGGATLFRGPAGCGKTTLALDLYRHFSHAVSPGRCLLIVPGEPSASAIRDRLLAESPSRTIFSPLVLTFENFSRRVLAASGEHHRFLDKEQFRLLLRRIVDDLASRKKLRALAGAADTPGIIASLDAAIGELKRSAVEPDHLARAVADSDAKGHDLLEIYRRYQEILQEQQAVDTEGRAWLARIRLARWSESDSVDAGLSGITAAAVDGFADFTPTQLKMLQLLSTRLSHVLITLPHAEDDRKRMWHWTNRTLNNIRATFGANLREIVADKNAEADDAPLRPLCRNVFDPEAPVRPLPAGVSFIAASGVDAEVAAVARRVKKLLLAGGKPGEIVLLARAAEKYRPAIARIFAQCDLPVAPPRELLMETPILRFLFDAAALPQDDFKYSSVLRVVASSYFLPDAMGSHFSPEDVSTARRLIHEGNVLAGRTAYAEAARRLQALATLRLERDADDEEIEENTRRPTVDFLRAADLLEKLFTLAEEAQSAQNTSAGAAEMLKKLAEDLCLRRSAMTVENPLLAARDLRALEELSRVLEKFADAPATLANIREALAETTCPSPRTESVVDVLDVLDARPMPYRHVFLLGLNEGVFPQRVREGTLIDEAQRVAWAARSIPLDSRRDLSAREMLLFYLAISRARESLTISFLESDAGGKETASSNFLSAMLAGFGGLESAEKSSAWMKIAPGDFLPTAEEIASRREAAAAAVAGRFLPAYDPRCAALRWARTSAPRAIDDAAGGILAQYRRWRRGACDAFDGRIDDPALRESLAKRFPDETIFSASKLNTYGQCPWQFFAQYLLRLEKLEEPQRLLQPVTRGLLIHQALYRVMTRLRENVDGPVRLAAIPEDQLRQTLDAVVDELAREDESRALYPALWQVQMDQIRRQLRTYLLNQRENSEGFECLHFELAFGIDDGEIGECDPASVRDCVTLSPEAGSIRLRGKIDRLDRVLAGENPGLYVVDYKTGSLSGGKDIVEGRSLQLPLYAAAAESLLGGKSIGGAMHRVGDEFKKIEFSALQKPRKDRAPYEDRQAMAMERVGRFVQSMKEGCFDAVPTHDCPRWCAMRKICHFAEARARRKDALFAAKPEDGHE